jgi:hypothetical protein
VPVNATARSLPLRRCGAAETVLVNMNWMLPDRRSISAGPLPLYGTWTTRMPTIVLKRSMPKKCRLPCPDVP